jgi:hypothetical protein
MSRNITKPTTPKLARDAKDAASRLKSDLMKDALGRMSPQHAAADTQARRMLDMRKP